MALIDKLTNWDKISDIEQIELSKMNSLDLSNLKLLKIPKSIENLEQLQTLNLDNNLITKLPNWLSKFEQLRFIYLNNNPLIECPESLLVKLNNSFNRFWQISVFNTLIPKIVAYQTNNYYFIDNLSTTTLFRKDYEDVKPMILKNLGFEVDKKEYEENKELLEKMINAYPFHTYYIKNRMTINNFLKRAYDKLLPQNDELKTKMLEAVGINATTKDYQENREVLDNLLKIYINNQKILAEYTAKHLTECPLLIDFYEKITTIQITKEHEIIL